MQLSGIYMYIQLRVYITILVTITTNNNNDNVSESNRRRHLCKKTNKNAVCHYERLKNCVHQRLMALGLALIVAFLLYVVLYEVECKCPMALFVL